MSNFWLKDKTLELFVVDEICVDITLTITYVTTDDEWVGDKWTNKRLMEFPVLCSGRACFVGVLWNGKRYMQELISPFNVVFGNIVRIEPYGLSLTGF